MIVGEKLFVAFSSDDRQNKVMMHQHQQLKNPEQTSIQFQIHEEGLKIIGKSDQKYLTRDGPKEFNPNTITQVIA